MPSINDRIANHYDGKRNTATNHHPFLRDRSLRLAVPACISVSPDRVRAGDRTTLRFTVTNGHSILTAGTRFRIFAVGYNPFGRIGNSEPDEARVVVDSPSARTEFEVAGRGFTGREIEVTLIEELPGGASFDVVLGPDGTFEVAELALPLTFHLEIDGALSGRTVVEVDPLEPESIECIIPAEAGSGEHVDLRILVRDRYLNPVDGEYRFRLSAPELTGIGECTLVRGDGGARFFRGHFTAPAPGTTRLTGREERTGIAVVSNPMRSTAASREYRLCFGDVHCHDYLSPGRGSTRECYEHACELGLDFLALPIQTQGGNLGDRRWTISNTFAEEYYRPGVFVSIPAFEWQDYAFGHKNVYYLHPDQPYLSPYDDRSDTVEKLFAELRRTDSLVIAHHIAYALDCHVPGTDWTWTDERLQPSVELCSVHGCCETSDGERPLVRNAAGPYFREVLEAGHHLGVIGGSDSHNGWPVRGVREPRPYPGGMACVFALELTREGIFEALRARRSYATTGARIVLSFTVEGAVMGEIIGYTERRTIRASIAGTAPIERVIVVKNGDELRVEQPSGAMDYELEITDTAEGASREDWYYLKVVQSDGELAISSPVWVSAEA